MDAQPDDAEGWSRAGQNAAEAEFPDVAPEEVAYLEQRVGYVSRRWVVVLIGAILGAVIGGVIARFATPSPGLSGFGDWITVRGVAIVFVGLPVGALIGGVATGLVLSRKAENDRSQMCS